MHPPVRLVAIDMDGTLLPTFSQSISPRNAKALRAAQQAGITVAIATGRRTAYTAPLLAGLGLRADMPLITSNGAVTRTLGGDPIDRSHLEARVARGLCSLLGPSEHSSSPSTTSDTANSSWKTSNRRMTGSIFGLKPIADAIEVVQPLENALPDGNDPIQGMVTGGLDKMHRPNRR